MSMPFGDWYTDLVTLTMSPLQLAEPEYEAIIAALSAFVTLTLSVLPVVRHSPSTIVDVLPKMLRATYTSSFELLASKCVNLTSGSQPNASTPQLSSNNGENPK
ncbi:unnamed protein product [Phytophthora lilii]|uniref:Unnamed protein product n=1 Tax=Phytophthora lilii TaxID=2077276 RepID=A0A9W6U1S6_9STRA|nr:unnamed protein product [Phytophthora lilii]